LGAVVSSTVIKMLNIYRGHWLSLS
jgi:hypothetical protein